jgi:SAM-dependent methyltransferase
MQVKQHVLSCLRAIGWLSLAEQLHFSLDETSTKADNKQFCLEQPDFTPPPLHVIHDAHGSTSFRHYWQGGRAQAKVIADLIRENHADARRVLEWGCGPGRIIRHLLALLPAGTQIFGSDYNPDSVAWCTRAIPGITFSINQLEPPLHFDLASFDVIYAISVLTHLSVAQQTAWMAELRRVLKTSGVLILTTHGDMSARRLLPGEYKQYLSQGVVVRDGVAEGKRCFLSYHHPTYAANHLFSDFRVLKKIDGNPVYEQDIWVLAAL